MSSTFSSASRRPASSSGSSPWAAKSRSASETLSAGAGDPPVSNLRVSSATAASPPDLTAARISATASDTELAAGISARSVSASSAAPPGRILSGSEAIEPLQQRVDRLRLELVGDRVGDQPGGAACDLLPHDQAVLTQCR